ncbi:L-rhamnose mutarotase [Microbacterium sp. LWH7-1.2]|uniref:L-rhamnose mutarotase n=1 Tax=Microbacterium sp. LWH7-1.2 TaxID=3135257 RepID=UPI003139B0F7
MTDEGTTADKMQRVCFVMHLKPERVTDYLAVHASVWPEVLDALRETGWTNFSLFVRPDDGLVVGYVETADYEMSVAEMGRRDVNTRWQETMAPYFDSGRPDQAVQRLEQYFHLV